MIKLHDMQQKITPHLWFDKQAREAVDFYISVFPNSKIKGSAVIHDTPSGTVDILTVELAGHEFICMNAGPLFTFNPSISFRIDCETKEEAEAFWGKLSVGAMVLMELGTYPFSEKYGWLQDRYGVSWQIMYVGDRKIKQKITPMLMFIGNQAGRAEEAIKLYTSVFHNSAMGQSMRYGKNEEPDKEGTLKFAAFTLEGQEFAAMDSAHPHKFAFNEAISLLVHCDSQQEIDYFSEKLSADPKAEQCGWIKDKFGLSWQIHPTLVGKMLEDKDEKKVARVTQAFLKMKKFNIEEVKKAYEGK